MKSTCFVFTFLIMGVLACKTDDTEMNEKFIVGMGNSSNMIVFNPPVKVKPDTRHDKYDPFKIDLNTDGVFDLQFSGFVQGYPGGGINQTTQINMLNYDFSISIDSSASIVMRDTVLLCIDTIDISTCKDAPLFFYRPTPEIYNFGDTLIDDLTFEHSEFFVLSHTDDSEYGRAFPHSIIRKSGIWMGVRQKYLVFRSDVHDTIRYGWINLSITEYSEILIYGYSF
jgi:hypothetical protein